MLPQEAISEFMEIYEREFGEKLEYAEAELRANKLVNLYQTILSHKVQASKDEVKDHDLRSAS